MNTPSLQTPLDKLLTTAREGLKDLNKPAASETAFATSMLAVGCTLENIREDLRKWREERQKHPYK